MTREQRLLGLGAAGWAVFGVAQLAGESPLFWMVFALVTAMYTLAVIRRRLPRGLALIWGALALAMATWLVAAWDPGPADAPVWLGPFAYRAGRDVAGLAAVTAWSAVLAWRSPWTPS